MFTFRFLHIFEDSKLRKTLARIQSQLNIIEMNQQEQLAQLEAIETQLNKVFEEVANVSATQKTEIERLVAELSAMNVLNDSIAAKITAIKEGTDRLDAINEDAAPVVE